MGFGVNLGRYLVLPSIGVWSQQDTTLWVSCPSSKREGSQHPSCIRRKRDDEFMKLRARLGVGLGAHSPTDRKEGGDHQGVTVVCVAMGGCTQGCPSLCDPMDCLARQAPLHGILQATVLEWVANASSRGSSWPRDWTCDSCSSWIGRWVLYLEKSPWELYWKDPKHCPRSPCPC